ncbi:MAG: C45 family autoproteolytic acyltransferase/hydrolase [bacterium]|nr:C45 family autoproteolytic acyltransferase/hydrolase [bacterium]
MTSEWNYSSDRRGMATFIHGWYYLRLEGSPYECGLQHGELLANYISETIARMKRLVYVETGLTWEYFKQMAYDNWKDKLYQELTEELNGIVDGVNKRVQQKIEFQDLLLWNGYTEVVSYWYPSHGVEIYKDVTNGKVTSGRQFQSRAEDSCSAFLATGSYTKDGSIVAAHNSFEPFENARYSNVIIDITPCNGHSFKMQSQPGYVHSMTDFYVTDIPMVITETTIGGFCVYDPDGVPEFVRIRRAVQFSNSLEEFVTIMLDRNSGGYANTWLVGDYRTNEIMRFELGLNYYAVDKTSDGAYAGFNAPLDPRIRNLECSNSGFADIRRHQGARQVRLPKLLDKFRGIIDEKIAKQIISDHYDEYLNKVNPCSRTICAHYECDPREYMSQPGRPLPFAPRGAIDGKICTRQFAYCRGFVARYGAPCGKEFDAEKFFKEHPQFLYLKEFIISRPSEPWTYFG